MIVQNNMSALSNNQVANTTSNHIENEIKTSKNDLAAQSADKSVELSLSDSGHGRLNNSANESLQTEISRLQLQEDSLTSLSEMLVQMTELCIQASKYGQTAANKREISSEIQQLKVQIAQTSSSSSFNGDKLFDDDALSLHALGLSDDNISTEQVRNAADQVDKMKTSVASQRKELEKTDEKPKVFKLDDSAFEQDVVAASESVMASAGNKRGLIFKLLQ